MKSSLTSDSKDWKYSVCEEFLLRESGNSKIPKALRYHVDIDDHKRLNVNPPIDKKEMTKCLRNLAIIRGTDARFRGLEQLNNKNALSPNPFSSSSSSFPPSSPPRWSSDGESQAGMTPGNVEANRARIISRLSEEQIRKLLLLLTEMLDKRMKPSPELGKVPIHGKLTPLMYSSTLGFKSPGQRRRPPLPTGPHSSAPGNKFPILTPLSGSGNSIDGGSSNMIDSNSPMPFSNEFGFNSPSFSSSRGVRPYSRFTSSSSYGPLSSPSYSGYSPFHPSSYPMVSPLYTHNHHPATQVTRFPFTSPTGVKKLLVNEVLGVKKVEKYNGEREVEVGGGPKTVVVHEGELHVDPSGESSAIEIDENKMKQYRDNYLTGYGGYPRFSGLSGRPGATGDRYGSSFYDSFRDSPFPNDPSFPGSPLDSSGSSQTELSALPVSPPPIGRYHRDKHNHHRHQSYHNNNGNEYVYSSEQGSTSHPSPGLQVTKCDETGTCTGPGIDGEEESIKSKYKANNSATRAAYGRYGAKYLGLTLTSIANYALGNLMGVLYSPFMKGRDYDKSGKAKPDKKHPTSIPIGGRPAKGMFDPTNGMKMNGKPPGSTGPALDQEIENMLDDYDDLDGDSNKARRRKRRR
ncbi:uncharacterized protein LOC107365591 [Tetranychus urticae]|uniref:uncharacterized protein LOC107365591 n=1 Tax=Tetranychus urticae TaxID=32264 RepID=UPI00077BF529|nr:uncharacterized protein LOC107365591 [Tetranychus urticae]XP_025017276.1 uncharacterized protein LOC107365591 [Tetranychus urticae]